MSTRDEVHTSNQNFSDLPSPSISFASTNLLKNFATVSVGYQPVNAQIFLSEPVCEKYSKRQLQGWHCAPIEVGLPKGDFECTNVDGRPWEYRKLDSK